MLIIFSFLLFYFFLSLELGLCFTRFTCRRICVCRRAWRISYLISFWRSLFWVTLGLGLGLRICCEWLEEIIGWLVIVTGFWLFWFLGLWDVRLSLFCSSASIIGLSLASMLLCLCFILSFITTFGVEFGHFLPGFG